MRLDRTDFKDTCGCACSAIVTSVRHTPHANAADWLSLAALALMWGSAFGFTRVALERLDPATLVAVRVAIGALVLFVYLRVSGRAATGDHARLSLLLVLALTGFAVPFWLIGWGQQRVDSGLAGILMGVMPLFTLVLAHFFVGERLTPRRATGFALGFSGIVALSGPQVLLELGGNASQLWRQLAIVGGAISYSINAVVARNAVGVTPLRLAVGSLTLASLLMLPTAATLERPWLASMDTRSAFAAGWLGLVATGLATLLYFRIIARAGATFLSQINFVIPLIAVGGGALALGEVPPTEAWVALSLVLSGMLLAR